MLQSPNSTIVSWHCISNQDNFQGLHISYLTWHLMNFISIATILEWCSWGYKIIYVLYQFSQSICLIHLSLTYNLQLINTIFGVSEKPQNVLERIRLVTSTHATFRVSARSQHSEETPLIQTHGPCDLAIKDGGSELNFQLIMRDYSFIEF